MAQQGSTNLSRSIVKAMGMFGSLQVFNILCSVIRTKFVALWIGPVGVGLFAIFNSAIELVSNISNMGMRTSSIRNISQETDNLSRLIRVCAAVRRWAWMLGLLGAVAMACLSPVLSQMTFGDGSHNGGFIVLSIAVLANALTSGEHSILQGTSMLRRLAKASLYGSFLGLLLSVPLFYYLGEDSIIPSILSYSLSILFFSYLMRNKDVSLRDGTLSMKDAMAIGKDFLKLGAFITICDIVSQITNYAFISYLNHAGGTSSVGYYQAGYTLISRYTGLIFSALSVEYYPRLAKIAHSNIKTNVFVSKELNIMLMLLTPIMVGFILFRRVIIGILYTEDFYEIETFISIGMVGMIFRAVSWCMAYVILAKGRGKLYFITETLSTAIFLLLYILAYHNMGIDGFGYAFMLWYAAYAVIVGICYYKVFGLRLAKSCYAWMLWAMVSSVSTIVFMQYGCIVGTVVVFMLTIGYSCMQFRRMMVGCK